MENFIKLLELVNRNENGQFLHKMLGLVYRYEMAQLMLFWRLYIHFEIFGANSRS